MDIRKIESLDAELVHASKKVRLLRSLEWASGSAEKFLNNWRRGNPLLPEVTTRPVKLDESISALESIAQRCSQDDPVEKFLAETAQSYADSARMLSTIGTREFTRYSARVFGRPDTIYKNIGMSAVDSAKYFLTVTDALLGNSQLFPSTPGEVSSEDFASWLRSEVDEFFDHDVVEVVIDRNMSSKALAGATRIRIRGNTEFSQLDKDQLLYHEAFVHTATQLNGKKQQNLKSLGLAAPRTTRTQEGIAVTAELMTNAMDITRLRRIALRVIAVQKALDGADFLDVFGFFVNAGQTPEESVRSAQRIFRGGAVQGGVVFTKDAVYLQGLLEVHTFMRLAIHDNRPDLIRNLFAGRLTMADVLRLAPLFKTGWLNPPAYLPEWASDMRRLGAKMAYSAFVSNVRLDDVYLGRAIEFEDELKGEAV